ncbi:SDR family NAD(P)-dependent oxidoreductase, partial [Desulfovibrio sp.]|uniref:SDR family NAD(P)-dependent oxidoreductase n=1 Tax=Desulfovibrio sp. TaxID=885 RepID=UPI0025C433DD
CVLDVEKGLSDEEMACILETAITHRVASTALTSLVAARSGVFWQEAPVDISLTGESVSAMRLREGAAYIVLGGSGGIGRTFMHELAAQAIAQQCRITLVPVQRQPRSVDFWEQIENSWVAVQPCSVDLNDHEAFMKAVDTVLAQYDKIGGIVHASGVTGGGLMQAQSDGVQNTENWNAKVVPLLGIEKILQHRNVDFVVLNSSIGALCGSVGQLDNTVANILLDVWASRQQAQAGSRVLSLRWDVWRQVGMINKMASLHERLSGEELKGGITPNEAMLAFRTCFAADVATPVVSGRNLLSMLSESRARRGLATDALESANLKVEGAASQRPVLAVPWKGARHVLDSVLIALFEARLGLTGIGIDDDYVELGGDSLMAMPLAKEIRELLDLSSFSVAQIFRRRNVANIADALTESPEEKERLFALAELLESIKRMTPGEVSKSLEVLS